MNQYVSTVSHFLKYVTIVLFGFTNGRRSNGNVTLNFLNATLTRLTKFSLSLTKIFHQFAEAEFSRCSQPLLAFERRSAWRHGCSSTGCPVRKTATDWVLFCLVTPDLEAMLGNGVVFGEQNEFSFV